MTIEAAQTIHELNTSFPRSTDLLKEGDDHIRMIKATLQRTFPRITDTVNISSNTLNLLDSSISASSTGISFTTPITLGNGSGIKVDGNSSITMGSGTSFNGGGVRLQNIGRATASTDAINLDYLIKEFGNRIFPIGSIYTTTGGENPTNIWGGTWQVVAQGRYIMGAGAGGSSGWQVGNTSTGGTTSFTIGVNNLPAHGHVVPEHGHGAWSDGMSANWAHSHALPWKNNNNGNGNRDGIRADGSGDGSGVVWANARTETIDTNHTHAIHVNNQGAFWTQNTGSGAAIGYIPAFYGMTFWRRTGLN